jgi:adenylosuccinate synthase
VLEVVSGWRQDTVGIVEYDELPAAARRYVELIEERVGATVAVISTGPRREETIVRPHADVAIAPVAPPSGARRAL